TFQTRDFSWIDPLKDQKGITESIENGTMSATQQMINSGLDPELIKSQQLIDAEHKAKLAKILNQTVDTKQVSIQKQIDKGVDDAELLKDD
ncbi:hypothetical protein L3V83_15765, partial [Thiotrichales bacterium 19X7-9]|nr:hypothetical protein [Thiotrichales bacterium 19X7-9]